MAGSSLPWYRQSLQRLASDMSSLLGEEEVPLVAIEVLETQLELIYRELVCLEVLGNLSASEVSALELCGQALEELRAITTISGHSGVDVEYESSLTVSAGRPRYDIPKDQLEFLLQSKFSVPQISLLLNVSVRTIRRRMEQYELSVRALYSTLSDQDLDNVVRSIQARFGLCGNRQMMGHLLAQGIRVQQHRIRESQRRVDPDGSVLRRLTTINRRQYSVRGPLALWHIDGNHKLIR